MPTKSEMMAQRLEKFARYTAKGMSETPTLSPAEREKLRQRIRLTFKPTARELMDESKRRRADIQRRERLRERKRRQTL